MDVLRMFIAMHDRPRRLRSTAGQQPAMMIRSSARPSVHSSSYVSKQARSFELSALCSLVEIS